jgi:zinc transporter, ZIP family
VATASISFLLLVGGFGGATAIGNVRGAPLTGVLSFATVALLYLVTEELLTEAHEQPDTPLLTAIFLVGFLSLLLISMIRG